MRFLSIDYAIARAFDHVDHASFIAKLQREFNMPTMLLSLYVRFVI